MLRLAGALLLLGGGLTLGLGAGRELARRAEALEVWRAALGLLMGELEFRLPPMPELLELLAQRASSPAAEVFAAAREGLRRLGEKPFSAIWEEALAQCPGALTAEDMEPLVRLGPVLGRYSAEAQRAAAEGARQSLAARAVQVREDMRQKGRAYAAVGLSAGALAVILLV